MSECYRLWKCPAPARGRQSRHYFLMLPTADTSLPHRGKTITSLCPNSVDCRNVPPPQGKMTRHYKSYFYKELQRQKARQFRIYGSLKCYTCPPINNFIVIKNPWRRKARQLSPLPVWMGARILPSVHPASKHRPSKIITHHYLWHPYIFISYIYYWWGYMDLWSSIHEVELLLHRHVFHYDKIEHTTRHRWGEDNTTVRVDEDRHTHDWAPMRQKSSSSSTHPVYIRRGDGVVMTGFRQYKGYLMHSTCLHTCNTLHEDMTTIARSLIGYFLHTHSIDVINPASFFRKAQKLVNYTISEVGFHLKHRRRRRRKTSMWIMYFVNLQWLMKYMIPHCICVQILFLLSSNFLFSQTKLKCYKLTILNGKQLIHSHTFHAGYLCPQHT
jgi:hypothetical protein